MIRPDRDMKIERITAGKTEAFLIADRSFEKLDAPFVQWLRSEGFTFGGYHGNYGCWWMYVNITRKLYAYGMPGVSLVCPIGGHAITIREFMEIYQIYKKYEGNEVYVFHDEPFDMGP